ncbi:MAG: hypothetical protein JWM33_1816 [Caulobacteraceae bacterium]|nr:hypothetical protein [Caulobacteraceae bacterium]
MSLDPNLTQTVIRIDPVTHSKEVITEYRESSAGWWTAAVIAVVLILAGVFVLTNRDTETNRSAIQAAADQGRVQGLLEGAQTSTNSANDAVNQAAVATIQAAGSAQQAANQAARSADQAAANASATERDTSPSLGVSGQASPQ